MANKWDLDGVSASTANILTASGFVGDITGDVTGDITGDIASASTTAAGAGLIGTSTFTTPTEQRYEENGVIVTTIKFDVTGLASVATANDVIGLAAGGAALLHTHVEATDGVIFRTELSCLETPTGGDNDINIVENTSAVLAYDGAGGTAYLSNAGDLLKGQTIVNNVPALTTAYSWYLTAGTGDVAAAYTAGQYVLRTYGNAVLA